MLPRSFPVVAALAGLRVAVSGDTCESDTGDYRNAFARMQTIGKDAKHRGFEVLWIPVPSLQDPAAYTTNTTVFLTPKAMRRALLPLIGGRRTVENLQNPFYGRVQWTHLFCS
jgi:hypothetical protein